MRQGGQLCQRGFLFVCRGKNESGPLTGSHIRADSPHEHRDGTGPFRVQKQARYQHALGPGRKSNRDRLNQAPGRGKPDQRQEQQRKLEKEREWLRQFEFELQPERDSGQGWELKE